MMRIGTEPGRAALWALAILLSSPPTQAGPGPEKRPFKREWLRPYLARGRGAEARRALLTGQPELAVKALERHLRRRWASERPQARYLLAHALLEAGEHAGGGKERSDAARRSGATNVTARAAALFEALEREYPLLVDYHRFHGAQCRYRLKQFEKAAALAASVAAASPLKQDAELLRADALRAQGQHREVAAIWEAFLKRFPGGRRVGQAHLRIGQALEQLAAQANTKEDRGELLAGALEHYKQVVIQAPLWRRVGEAQSRLAALVPKVKDGKERARLSPWQRFTQARVYYREMRHTQAEPAFSALLKEKKLDPKLRCKATYHLAMTVYRRRERARAAPIFKKAAEHCRVAKQPELTLRSLYNGAKGLMRARKFDEAIAQLGQVEREFKTHSWADDARLWAAEAAEAKGDKETAAQLLSGLPDRYPRGDMAREALWRLARAAIIDRRDRVALKHLDRIIGEMGRARYYYAEGQALYWKARLLERGKRRREARAFYERCIREYPLSYYALQAFNRLRDGHRARYRALRRELIDAAGRKAGAWTFAPRRLFGRPGFLRAVELARLGFGAAAAAELARVGVAARRGSDRDDLWLAAVLFDRAGIWDRSHQVPRSIDRAYARGYPLGEAYRRWQIAYPRAFRPLVEDSARKAGIAREAIWAVMREESGFSPTIESWANAVGLMQLLIRTARKAGNEHRIDVTRRRLHDPAVNIKLGATYLGFLHRTFGGNPALAVAGYNAGEGAVMRWLRKLRGVPLDELLDRVPYDQTRRYTKRVLSSLFAYSVLYRRGERRIPRLGQKVPAVKRVAFGRKKKNRKRKRRGKKRRSKARRR
jgi:soluble lytic murein transglycosylase